MDFDSLHSKYKEFFDHFKKLSKVNKIKYDNVFFMAIDGEWSQDGGKNIVLSYQLATASEHKTKNDIKFTVQGKRLKLGELIEFGIKSVNNKKFPSTLSKAKNLVILISHNFTAEWSILADRDENYITERLIQVRKSPITDRHPIKLTINKANIDIRFYDTMLLAPASHRALKKLSVLLGDKDKEKEKISQYHIENMNLYLRYHFKDYVKYALKDTEVTLQLFFMLQKALNELVDSGFRLYITLASAGVKGFLTANTKINKYFKALREPKFKRPYRLVKESYFGGRNENFFVGRTSNYPETKNKFWVDIDFTGAYPTAMALCPKIDPLGEIEYYPQKYAINKKAYEQLKNEHIPKGIIDGAKTAIKTSIEAFDQYLAELKNKKQSGIIREKATVINNKLVNRWYNLWKKSGIECDASLEEYLIPGFAKIRFNFKKCPEFPCLPVRHPVYGLIYPHKGVTTATASEIILAKANGATIYTLASMELPTEKKKGIPKLLTLKHLRKLALKRKDYKNDQKNPKSQVLEKLIKEFMNSFYGKFAQGINIKRNFRPSTGEQVYLQSSQITEPIIASLVTSLARAALSATLFSITEFNKNRPQKKDQVSVISATTDGLLIGLPAPTENFSVMDKYYGLNKNRQFGLKNGSEEELKSILQYCGCQSLMGNIDKHLATRQMRKSRELLSDDRSILEVKHMADSVIAVKTRGQIGLLKTGHASILAKFGQKPPISNIMEDRIESERVAKEEYKRIQDAGGIDKNTVEAHWLIEQMDKLETGEVKTIEYPLYKLRGFREIFESEGKLDLTNNTGPRNLNINFDYKRQLNWKDGIENSTTSPLSTPFEDKSEMLKFRDQMESIKRTGEFASPDKVLNQIVVQGRSTRLSGGEPSGITRIFLRALMQEKILFKENRYTNIVWAQKLNNIWKEFDLEKNYPRTWRPGDLQNAKNGKWQPGSIQPNIILMDLVKKLSEEFEVDPKEAHKIIFANEEFKLHQTKQMEQVISAIIDAKKNNISPFKELYKDGLLPTIDQIKRRFKLNLSNDQIELFLKKKFKLKELSSHHFQEIKIMFRSLGIKPADAAKCAKCIVNTSKRKKPPKNPGKKICTENFFLALQTFEADHNIEIKDKFKILSDPDFGLTWNQYKDLDGQRFASDSIKNTMLNKRQIRQMAKAFNLDGNRFIDEMISK